MNSGMQGNSSSSLIHPDSSSDPNVNPFISEEDEIRFKSQANIFKPQRAPLASMIGQKFTNPQNIFSKKEESSKNDIPDQFDHYRENFHPNQG
jgi:hypothetical protein